MDGEGELGFFGGGRWWFGIGSSEIPGAGGQGNTRNRKEFVLSRGWKTVKSERTRERKREIRKRGRRGGCSRGGTAWQLQRTGEEGR